MALPLTADTTQFEIEKLVATNPAAGGNFTYNITANRRISPISIQFLLSSDANAANRQGVISFNLGAPLDLIIGGDPVQTALQARFHTWIAGVGFPVETTGTQQYINSLPNDLWLTSRHAISSNVDNIQVGDTITSIIIIAKVQVWPF